MFAKSNSMDNREELLSLKLIKKNKKKCQLTVRITKE